MRSRNMYIFFPYLNAVEIDLFILRIVLFYWFAPGNYKIKLNIKNIATSTSLGGSKYIFHTNL